MWAKEWRMLMWPAGTFAMALAWFILAIILLSYLQEYQSIAIELSNLSNQRGATELLLVQANQAVLNMMILWSIYFGARSFALERQWSSDILYFGTCRLIWRVMYYKIAVLGVTMALISLPFWVFYMGLIRASGWDNGVVFGIFLAQLVMILYAGLLSLAVSVVIAQALTGSLILALIWLFLWLAPTLVTQPDALVSMLRWVSPFEHTALLVRGMISGQTLIFVLLHSLIFMTLISIYWVKDR